MRTIIIVAHVKRDLIQERKEMMKLWNKQFVSNEVAVCGSYPTFANSFVLSLSYKTQCSSPWTSLTWILLGKTL